ncbi:MAG TPA: ABC transporter ATP-binding protein [Chryseosolibacter sp.]|nr:ABC transporter ATP-binding protein [Chryseosolibacter sp.]
MKIQTENLSKRFNYEWIFRNLSYEFSGGNIYAITGPNGSGKSTLLSVISGQIPPTSGSIHYSNADSAISSEDIYKELTIAAPYMDLMEELTLEEHLRFHIRMRPLRDQISVDDLIDIMYLQNARTKYIGNFSSGMKQRVKLGLAFFSISRIVILDEPLSNLDKEAALWYHKHLAGLPADVLTIIASNNPEEYPESAINVNVSDYKK